MRNLTLIYIIILIFTSFFIIILYNQNDSLKEKNTELLEHLALSEESNIDLKEELLENNTQNKSITYSKNLLKKIATSKDKELKTLQIKISQEQKKNKILEDQNLKSEETVKNLLSSHTLIDKQTPSDIDCFVRSIEYTSKKIKNYSINRHVLTEYLNLKNEAYDLYLSSRSDGTRTVDLKKESFNQLRSIGINFYKNEQVLSKNSINGIITLPLPYFQGIERLDLDKFLKVKNGSINYHSSPVIGYDKTYIYLYNSFTQKELKIYRDEIETENGKLIFPILLWK